MAKILIINPNKWGRGITHLWIASHSSLLKKNNQKVEFFDCTFYEQWSLNEIKEQQKSKIYKKSEYEKNIKYNPNDIYEELQKTVNKFQPDIIFWSSISSHIHAEGEYVNIQNGHELINRINTDAIKITGGLQATADPELVLKELKGIDYLIGGETENVLIEVCKFFDSKKDLKAIAGMSYIENNKFFSNKKQEIIKNLDLLCPYDYDIFDEQVFLRPYNGEIIKAVDYEMSRGCIYSCSYCVETIIQNYYEFKDRSNKSGAIKNFKNYLRSKSASKIYEELEYLSKKKGIKLIRCQDTNFLTNDRKILEELASMMEKKKLDIFLYIETRPEGINDSSISLLKRLKVDGIGMGVELSDEVFREDYLNRFADQKKTIDAFDLLKKNKIKRTAYNIIGLPYQNENSILETIKLNKRLDPNNITVSYYSPYYGTKSQKDSFKSGDFEEYERDVDNAFRTKSKSKLLKKETLEYYKKNFIDLVRSE